MTAQGFFVLGDVTHMKGIRGANGVQANTKDAILEATSQLLAEIVQRNHLDPTEVVSALFTLTPDLNAAFPATAARDHGLGGRAPHVRAGDPGARTRSLPLSAFCCLWSADSRFNMCIWAAPGD